MFRVNSVSAFKSVQKHFPRGLINLWASYAKTRRDKKSCSALIASSAVNCKIVDFTFFDTVYGLDDGGNDNKILSH